MGLFGKKKNMAPEQWRDVRWGTSSPVIVRLSSGMGRIRAFGTFSCEVADEGLLRENGCDRANEDSLSQYADYLSRTVISVFTDELGVLSRHMSEEELLGSSKFLSEAVMNQASALLESKGVSLTNFGIERILNS